MNWKKIRHPLKSGPWRGEAVYLDAYGDACTAWFTVNGERGRYVKGRWQPERPPQEPRR